ncbi:hypothetical protein RFI_02064, partial [Reticulomyxa filosa]
KIAVLTLDTFSVSSKLLATFHGHTSYVYSIDCRTFDDCQFICSGSEDKTVRVWDIETNKQSQSFNIHSGSVYCVKFSPYHYRSSRRNVVCSSSSDNTISFWDTTNNRQLQLFNGHTLGVCAIEFSPFNGGRYLCSGSFDKSVRVWDIKTSKTLHVFNGHTDGVWCVDISPLQSNINNKASSAGIIGGNGYTICSGSFDKTIRMWDIETTKQLIIFEGHQDWVNSVKYGSNELGNIGGANTILSGSNDKSVRLWDIRSGKQIQEFCGHKHYVNVVEYSPFAMNNSMIGGSSNVICSGSFDKTIRFWDIRSNKKALYRIGGNNVIFCLKFFESKKKENTNKNNNDYGINLCYEAHDETTLNQIFFEISFDFSFYFIFLNFSTHLFYLLITVSFLCFVERIGACFQQKKILTLNSCNFKIIKF